MKKIQLLLPLMIIVLIPSAGQGAPYKFEHMSTVNQAGYQVTPELPAGLEIEYILPRVKLTPSDAKITPPNFKQFGSAIATSGDGNLVAVGGPDADIDLNQDGKIQGFNEMGLGKVYLYRENNGNWVESQLTASDGSSSDSFGSSVAVSSDGKMIVVGAKNDAPHTFSGAGSVYVYEEVQSSRSAKKGWKETKLYLPSWAAQTFDFFGASVDISKDNKRIVIGAPGSYLPAGSKKGTVYLYEKKISGWVKVNQFDAYDTNGWFLWDGFGESVAISEDGKIVVVGSPAQNMDQGGAYMYIEDPLGWWEYKLDITPAGSPPVYLNPMDKFGFSVDIAGDLIVVGTPQSLYQYYYHNIWPAAGGVYVYLIVPEEIDYGEVKVKTSTCKLIKKLTYPQDANPGDDFGYSVSTGRTGDTSVVAIGSPGWTLNYCNYSNQGMAHIFSYNHKTQVWDHRRKLKIWDCTCLGDQDQFGTAVAVSGDCSTLAVGAPGSYSGFKPSEEAYLFKQILK